MFVGGPSPRVFAEAGTKKNRTESPRSGVAAWLLVLGLFAVTRVAVFPTFG